MPDPNLPRLPLRGTGSNIYNANLARALAGLGHEVHLFCQERSAQEPEGVTIHVPDIGRVLPVYVTDRYEGFDALPFPELDEEALGHYLDANVAAVRSVPSPDIALANHLVMGPVILARGLEGRAPYAVKIHGVRWNTPFGRIGSAFCPTPGKGLSARPACWWVHVTRLSVEAAACGVLPLSAAHSGMAEVTAALAPALPEELRPLLSFEIGPRAVEEIAAKLVAWLTLDDAERKRARLALAEEAARRYSWEKVAKGVIAAAQGRLNELCPCRPAG